jgi:NTP pyrophosphatase (non-canonical NTP hydrolase)
MSYGYVDGDDINRLVQRCFTASFEAGWWDGLYEVPKTVHIPTDGGLKLKPLVVATKLMLTVSELSEAMEGDRKNKMDDHLPDRKMVEVELADACIRIFDLAGALGLDLGGAIIEKMAYNAQRADHKRENRAKDDGKKY